jgi:hypothetical protein
MVESFTLYLSPLEPSTIKKVSTSRGMDSDDTEFTLYLIPHYRVIAPVAFDLGLRKNYEESMFEVLRDSTNFPISWERANYIVGGFAGNYTRKSMPGIFIYIDHPTGRIEAKPYWIGTSISAFNANTIIRYFSFAYYKGDHNGVKGKIQSEKWISTLIEQTKYQDTQPDCTPGEYLQLKWYLHINGKYFAHTPNIVKFETPLLTGGIIKSKSGEGIETTYTVEIFGVEVSGIKPTDFYEYNTTGSNVWVFLMKTNASFNDGEEQFYGSDDIDEVSTNGDDYRIVPFTLGGLTNTYCAIPSNKAIHYEFSDTAWDFDEVFNMKSYTGEIISVDYDNDTAVVSILDEGEKTLPIFYYCEEAEDIVGGSNAFKEGDVCLIETPASNKWEDSYIIGFPDEIKHCISPDVMALLAYYIEGEGLQSYVIIDLNTKALINLVDPNTLDPLLQPFATSSFSLSELYAANNLQSVPGTAIQTKVLPGVTETLGEEIGTFTEYSGWDPDRPDWYIKSKEEWAAYGPWPRDNYLTGPFTVTETYWLLSGNYEHVLWDHKGSLIDGIDLYRDKPGTSESQDLLNTTRSKEYHYKFKKFHQSSIDTCQLVLNFINNGPVNYEQYANGTETEYHLMENPDAGDNVWPTVVEKEGGLTIEAHSACDNNSDSAWVGTLSFRSLTDYYKEEGFSSGIIKYYSSLNMAIHTEVNRYEIFKTYEDWVDDISIKVKKQSIVYSYVNQSIENDPPQLKTIPESDLFSFFNVSPSTNTNIAHLETLIFTEEE